MVHQALAGCEGFPASLHAFLCTLISPVPVFLLLQDSAAGAVIYFVFYAAPFTPACVSEETNLERGGQSTALTLPPKNLEKQGMGHPCPDSQVLLQSCSSWIDANGCREEK